MNSYRRQKKRVILISVLLLVIPITQTILVYDKQGPISLIYCLLGMIWTFSLVSSYIYGFILSFKFLTKYLENYTTWYFYPIQLFDLLLPFVIAPYLMFRYFKYINAKINGDEFQ